MSSEDEAIPTLARLLRDFVNTREPQLNAESLATAEQLRDWLAAHQLLSADTRLSSRHLATALAVREGLRTILLGHAGHSGERTALEEYNAALAKLPVRLAFTDGAHRLVSAHGGPAEEALTQLVDAICRCEQDHTWHRLKVCARDTCRWAFYDASRNQTRRWCSMAGCGNHIKNKRAYATRRTRQQQAGEASPASRSDRGASQAR
jgi:predicted RNA-binding Zn ribbon-like protein